MALNSQAGMSDGHHNIFQSPSWLLFWGYVDPSSLARHVNLFTWKFHLPTYQDRNKGDSHSWAWLATTDIHYAPVYSSPRPFLYSNPPDCLLGRPWTHLCTESFSSWALTFLHMALPLRRQTTGPLSIISPFFCVFLSGLSAWGLPFLSPFLFQPFVLCIHIIFLVTVSHISKWP